MSSSRNDLSISKLKDRVSAKLGSARQNTSKSKSKTAASKKGKYNDSKEDVDEILRREAIEMGASENDLDLLEGVNDEEFENQEDNEILEFSEESGGKNVGKAELEDFIKQIGLDIAARSTGDDDEDKEEDDDDDDGDNGDYEHHDDDDDDDAIESHDQKEADGDNDYNKSGDLESNKEAQRKNKIKNSNELLTLDHASSIQSKKNKESGKQVSKKEEIKKMTIVNANNLIVPVKLDWYNIEQEISRSNSRSEKAVSSAEIEAFFEKARKLTEQENSTYYDEFSKKSSQKRFFTDILTGGTLNDKISALTLMIQEAPVHNLKSMDTLLSFCSKKSRTAALQSINSFKDLLVNGLLPRSRRLKYFKSQHISKDTSDELLILYYYEDFLKNRVFKLLEILERLSHDTVNHVKTNAVSTIFELLTSVPEQEQNLLNLGVNKLGDKDHKVGAQTSYALLQLEQAHPAMKPIITKAVIDFLNKNYENYNTKYYSVLTLNQTILTKKEVELANTLIKSYFSIFKRILDEQKKYEDEEKEHLNEIGSLKNGRTPNSRKNVKRGKKGGVSVKVEVKTENEIKQDQNSKLFSAVLTGLNRAFPFSELPDEVFIEHLDNLYKIVHSSNFGTTIQSLSLIQHIITEQNLDDTRYYRSLYDTLLDDRLVNSAKQGLYLNLLYRSLKLDTNIDRVLAFAKRILQICFNWINVGAICGVFYLLVQLSKHKPYLKMLLTKEIVRDQDTDDETTEFKHSEYDMSKRDPRYAHAEKTSLFEIIQFINHFHPSVKLYANALLGSDSTNDEDEIVKPDLGLYTLSHFLDKFVYKNPKQKAVTRGSSIMQPLGGSQTGTLLVKSSADGKSNIPVNLKDWFNKKIDDISPDERFFLEYFKNRKYEPKNMKIDAIEDEESDFDEDEVWKALIASKPDIDGEGDEFSDEDISFDSEDLASDEDTEDMNEEDRDVGLSSKKQSNDNSEPDYDSEQEALNEEFAKLDGSGSENNHNEEFYSFDDENSGNNGKDEASDVDDQETVDLFLNDDKDDEISSDHEISEVKRTKRHKTKKEKANKRQKVKDLPVFASVDDYAQYLDSDSD